MLNYLDNINVCSSNKAYKLKKNNLIILPDIPKGTYFE